MRMKRTFFLLAPLFLLTHECFSSDVQLSARLESSYKAGFYPGVVRYAEEILKGDVSSFTAVKAAVYEGESLFRMGRTDDALSLLKKYNLKSEDSVSSYLKSARNFWIGRCYFGQKNFEDAQKYFFESARLFSGVKRQDGKKDYYSDAILWGARTYINLRSEENNEEKAIPLLEYVVSNGEKFSQPDFEECAVNLAVCYNDCLLFEKTDSLVRQFESLFSSGDNSISGNALYSLLLLRGDAQRELKNYALAYKIYCDVIENAPPFIAAEAMKKAYAVSSEHKKEVGGEPGDVIARAQGRLAQFPKLLAEFWTRLAIDAFNAGDLKKSSSYFDEAEKSASDYELCLASVYRSQIVMASGGKDCCDEAIKILSDGFKISGAEDGSEISQYISVLLARFYAYKKDWNSCLSWAKSALDSKNADVLKEAWYWSALALYSDGRYAESYALIEQYEKNLAPKRKLSVESDSQLMTLYAKALAEDGKYSKSEAVFASLKKGGKLNNDGYLDYSRTLLKSAMYDSSKALASLADGDEALYLSALASFNQKRWMEAEILFDKVVFSKTLNSEHSAYALFYLGYCQYQLEEYLRARESLDKFTLENPDNHLLFPALITSARCASFSKKYDVAASRALSAVAAARSEDEKHAAVILCAGIYSDSQKFDEALRLLSPYVAKKDSFGYECKFRSAEIFVQKKDFKSADSYFEDVASSSGKNASVFAEDAFYRRGELKYMTKDFAGARVIFENYGKRWPEGKYFYAAVYFSADCLARIGDRDRAVLRYLQLAESDFSTSYRYAAQKNLIDLYESNGELKNAYEMAQKMLEEYGEQAVSDGIGEKSEEIALKMSGKKPELSEADVTDAQSAINLAAKFRNSGENKKAADMYLKAALFARQSGDNGSAERALYGAVEAFDAAGLYGDSKAAYNEMKKLYPKSSYTKEAKKLVQ